MRENNAEILKEPKVLEINFRQLFPRIFHQSPKIGSKIISDYGTRGGGNRQKRVISLHNSAAENALPRKFSWETPFLSFVFTCRAKTLIVAPSSTQTHTSTGMRDDEAPRQGKEDCALNRADRIEASISRRESGARKNEFHQLFGVEENILCRLSGKNVSSAERSAGRPKFTKVFPKMKRPRKGSETCGKGK